MWALDGTFDVVNELYTQLFTLHGITDEGWVFPLVYALLPDKKTSSYKYVLNELTFNAFGLLLNPTIVIMDFERAEINAVNAIFPNAKLQGCHFHFFQALHRHFSSEMKKHYSEDVNFCLLMKKIFALAFVKEEDVRLAFDLLVKCNMYKGKLNDDLKTFFDYVKSTYIGTEYAPPMYALSFWNVHRRVLDDRPRTNNSVTILLYVNAFCD